MTKTTDTAVPAPLLGGTGSNPIEDRLRETVRATIEALFDEELAVFPGRLSYGRGDGARKGYRHGRRERELVGTFGAETVSVPRARIEGEDGKTTEWRSKALPRYQRLTKRAEALIAAVYLAGTNTRRVKCALYSLFLGAVGKDVFSRASCATEGAERRRSAASKKGAQLGAGGRCRGPSRQTADPLIHE